MYSVSQRAAAPTNRKSPMPTINTSLPTTSRDFAGITFAVPAAFAEGHALTAGEAKWANFVLGSVVGNSYAGYVRRTLAAIDADRAAQAKAKTYSGPMDESGKKPAPATVADLGSIDHQTQFLKVFSEYELGASNRGSGTGTTTKTDPVASLVNFLAKEAVKALIIKKGLKVKTFMDAKVMVGAEETSKFMSLVADYKERHPELVDQAKAQLDAQNEGTSDDDGLDLSLSTTEGEAQEAA